MKYFHWTNSLEELNMNYSWLLWSTFSHLQNSEFTKTHKLNRLAGLSLAQLSPSLSTSFSITTNIWQQSKKMNNNFRSRVSILLHGSASKYFKSWNALYVLYRFINRLKEREWFSQEISTFIKVCLCCTSCIPKFLNIFIARVSRLEY